MKFDKHDLLLYAVTDRAWLGQATLAQQVEQAIQGGVSCVQLREKELDSAAFAQEAVQIRQLCRRYRVPFLINDNVDLALRCDADGVHVGQHDMAAAEARRLLGRDKILGVSVQTVEQAVAAQQQGADYLGVGAVFPTASKADADSVPYASLQAICQAVDIPVVAIGGIALSNVQQLAGSGICGIAVISAIFASPDIAQAAQQLRAAVTKVVQ